MRNSTAQTPRIGFAIALVPMLWVLVPCRAAEVKVENVESAAKAFASAQPGDSILLADGLYRDVNLDVEARATPDRPVTFRAANPGKVTITGNSSITLRGKGVVVSGLVFDQAWRGGPIVTFHRAQNCRLTDCAFIESGNPKSTFGRAIEMMGGSGHNRVDHCYMTGNLSMGMGVKVAEPDDLANTDNAFDHNYFLNITHRSSNGQEAIQLGQGGLDKTVLRAIVEYNLFDRASGDPEIISNKTSHNVLRYNTFRDCGRSELVLRGGHFVRVEGNFFFRCKGGIRVHGTDHTIINNYIEACGHGIILPDGGPAYTPVARCMIAFNTLVDCDKIGIAVGNSRAGAMRDAPATAPAVVLSPTDCRFANNLVTAGKGTLIDSTADKSLAWEQNLVWPRQKAQAGLKDAGIALEDPKLVQVDGLWRLPRTGSPAAGRAKAVQGLVVTEDIDGQPRKEALDAGCDQASDAPIVRRPLEPRDVGPTWMKGDPSCIKRIDHPQPIPAPAKKK